MATRFFLTVMCAVLWISGSFGQTIVEEFYTAEGGNSPISLKGGQRCGQRFTATLPFEGIEVNGPTWGVSGEKGMTIRLWRWAGSYEATVTQEPIAVSVLENLDDNGWFPCYAPSELEPGQYFWEASDPTNSNPDADPEQALQIGVWRWNGSRYGGGEAYFNGQSEADVSILWEDWFGRDQGGTWTPFPFPGGDNPTMAQSFESPEPLYGVGIVSPTWHGTGAGYRMSLYAWNTDYATTLAWTPLAQKTFSNITDNARNDLVLDSPAPPGRYLLVTDNPVRGTGNVGHWGWTFSDYADEYSVAYSNGEEMPDWVSFDIFLGFASEEPVGKDYASRSVTGVATIIPAWEIY